MNKILFLAESLEQLLDESTLADVARRLAPVLGKPTTATRGGLKYNFNDKGGKSLDLLITREQGRLSHMLMQVSKTGRKIVKQGRVDDFLGLVDALKGLIVQYKAISRRNNSQMTASVQESSPSFQANSLKKAKRYTQIAQKFLSAKGKAKDKLYLKLVAGWITFKNDTEDARLNMGTLPSLLDPLLSPLNRDVQLSLIHISEPTRPY